MITVFAPGEMLITTFCPVLPIPSKTSGNLAARRLITFVARL